MSADLIPFDFHGEAVRVITRDGEPWFVAADVCAVLDLGNPTQALTRLDDDERTLISNEGRQLNAISESGLYSLVLGSRKPEAKAFKRWITSEVLPAIRKHGGYLTPAMAEQVLSDPDTIIRLATDLKAERAKRIEAEQAKAQLETKVEADAPKVVFAEAVATSHTSILVRELAKVMQQAGVTVRPMELFDWLRRDGFLIRGAASDHNLPTQKSVGLGLFEIKETPIVHDDGRVSISRTPKVTGKGQTYLVDFYLRKAA